MIYLLVEDAAELGAMFLKNQSVFRILEGDERREMGMVTTLQDYEERITSHAYNPLLPVSILYLRLAYLYGCLNTRLGWPRKQKFLFLWRQKNTNKWVDWFEVVPYVDVVGAFMRSGEIVMKKEKES